MFSNRIYYVGMALIDWIISRPMLYKSISAIWRLICTLRRGTSRMPRDYWILAPNTEITVKVLQPSPLHTVLEHQPATSFISAWVVAISVIQSLFVVHYQVWPYFGRFQPMPEPNGLNYYPYQWMLYAADCSVISYRSIRR